MFRTLLASNSAPVSRRGGTAASVALHTLAIAAAVLATAQAHPARPRHSIAEPVYYARPHDAPPPASLPRTAATVPDPAPGQIRLPVIAPVAVPTHLPAIDLHGAVTDPNWFSGHVASPSDGTGHAGPPAPSPTQVFEAATVDRAVAPLPGNPAPAYPDFLRAANLEGTVLVRFVVDTLGRAEPSSIRIVSATQSAFAESVRRALLASRYRPAEVAGHPVRQLVEQTFSFALR